MRLFYYCILLFSIVTLGGCINDADPVDDPSGDPSVVVTDGNIMSFEKYARKYHIPCRKPLLLLDGLPLRVRMKPCRQARMSRELKKCNSICLIRKPKIS